MKSTADNARPGRVPRLYVEAMLDGRDVVLSSKQAHYLRQVLRLKRGQAVIVFDGRGSERIATIEKLTRDGAELQVTAPFARVPESPLELHLLQAIAKADAMDLIVQKTTELGVRAITPIITEFSVVKLDQARARHRLDHWRRIARSACEQSGRHAPTVIYDAVPLAACLQSLPSGATRLALDPLAEEAYRNVARQPGAAGALYLLVGPEGGLSDRDLKLVARAGFARVRIGPRIMRVETAAIAACALAQAYWGDLG